MVIVSPFDELVHDIKVHDDIRDLQEGRCVKLNTIKGYVSVGHTLMFALLSKPS